MTPLDPAIFLEAADFITPARAWGPHLSAFSRVHGELHSPYCTDADCFSIRGAILRAIGRHVGPNKVNTIHERYLGFMAMVLGRELEVFNGAAGRTQEECIDALKLTAHALTRLNKQALA